MEGPSERKYIKNVAAMMFCEHPEKFFKTTQVDNGSPSAVIDTDENRAYFLIDIPCHPDCLNDDLSQVVSQVEIADNENIDQKLYQVVYQVVYQVKDVDFEMLYKAFLMMLNPVSKTDLMKNLEVSNRSRFKRKCLDILVQSGLATLTIPDKPNSRFQKYTLTEKGRNIIERYVRGRN